MTDEMFAQLLQLVGSGGEGAFWLAVLYMGQAYFNTIVFGSCVLVGIIGIGRLFSLFSYVNHIGQVMGYTIEGPSSAGEREQLLLRISNMKRTSDNNRQ